MARYGDPQAFKNLKDGTTSTGGDAENCVCCDSSKGCSICLNLTGVNSTDKIVSAIFSILAVTVFFYAMSMALTQQGKGYLPISNPEAVTSALTAIGCSLGSFASQSIFGGGIPAILFGLIAVILNGESANFLLVQNGTALAQANVTGYRNVYWNPGAAATEGQIPFQLGLYLLCCIFCSAIVLIHLLVCIGSCNFLVSGESCLNPGFTRGSRLGRLKYRAFPQETSFTREWISMRDCMTWSTGASVHGNMTTVFAFLTLISILAVNIIALSLYMSPNQVMMPSTPSVVGLIGFGAGFRLWPFQPYSEVKSGRPMERYCRRAPLVQMVGWGVATIGLGVSIYLYVTDVQVNCSFSASCYSSVCSSQSKVNTGSAIYWYPPDGTRDCGSFVYFSPLLWGWMLAALVCGFLFWWSFTLESLALVAVYWHDELGAEHEKDDDEEERLT